MHYIAEDDTIGIRILAQILLHIGDGLINITVYL